jgi:hypothetical protein
VLSTILTRFRRTESRPTCRRYGVILRDGRNSSGHACQDQNVEIIIVTNGDIAPLGAAFTLAGIPWQRASRNGSRRVRSRVQQSMLDQADVIVASPVSLAIMSVAQSTIIEFVLAHRGLTTVRGEGVSIQLDGSESAKEMRNRLDVLFARRDSMSSM